MHHSTSLFNLHDTAAVVRNRWKPIAFFVAIVLALTTLILFFILPKKYKAEVVAVATNPSLADKARMFNTNIQLLYSNFGTSEDLDRLYGVARLDTIYKTLVDEFDLTTYYQVKGDSSLKQKNAVHDLKEDVTVQKTELNQLRIMVWNKGNRLAADMANRMMQIIENLLAEVWRSDYKRSIETLHNAIAQMEDEHRLLLDSGGPIAMAKKEGLLNSIQQYRKAANEIQLASANTIPALIILEKAYPAAKAAKPDKLMTLISAFLLALFFGICAALLVDRKTTS